jgi:hypothetical protein
MPQVLKHIDYIARQKQRDVLYLTFINEPFKSFFSEPEPSDHYWKQPNSIRSKILIWLDENGFSWKECGEPARISGWRSYAGQIYIDVPFDTNDPEYQKLVEYLEDGNGNIKPEFGNTQFWVMALDNAMKNAHHDEPGFWERWAEDF